MSFEETIEAARSGDERAFAILYDQLRRPVAGFVRLRGSDEVDDLVSEVFLQVFRNLAQFEGTEQGFRSWVFTIAHRRVIDARRTRERRPPTVPLPDDIDVTGIDNASAAVDASIDPGLRSILDSLTDRQRDVVLLHVVGGLPLREVANVTGRSLPAVKATQHRAVSALRRALDAERASAGASVSISET